MDYFVLEPDQTINQKIHLNVKEQDLTGSDAAFICADFKESEALPDLIKINRLFSSYFLMSDQLKELMSVYEEKIVCYPIILTSTFGGNQKAYWRAKLEAVDCFYERDVIQAEKVKLISDQIPEQYLFMARGARLEVLVVSLHLAENMLRKGYRGIRYIPVPVYDACEKETNR